MIPGSNKAFYAFFRRLGVSIRISMEGNKPVVTETFNISMDLIGQIYHYLDFFGCRKFNIKIIREYYAN